MADLLPIAQLGNPVLRHQAQPIAQVDASEIQQLIDSLIATLLKSQGVGIAAPQVSQSCRLLVVASHPNDRYPHAPHIEPMAMLNPRIIEQSSEVVKDWEGCLSIPGIRGFVPRYQSILVEYTDRTGKLQQQELQGFVARIFQHEYDHLEGKVFLDRVESTQEIVTDQEYRQRILPHLLAS
ncbi:MAG: peptide deformylase [Leptolyngbyaceae cyanobacterium bins.59]|nr:peptide deformylase [Leptolyngbyaceae cyanobacterium bins.59]